MATNSVLQVNNKNLIVVSQNKQKYKNQVLSFGVRNNVHNKFIIVLIVLQDKILLFKL